LAFSTLLPAFALALAAAIWGVSFPLIKDAYADISPVLLLSLRFSLGALLIALLTRPKNRPTPSTLRGGLLAGTFVGFGMILQMLGLARTSASNSGFLTSLYIVLVPFVAFFVYQVKPQWRELWAVPLAGGGIALLSLEPGSLRLGTGDLLTIASAVLFAFQVVLVQRYTTLGRHSPGQDHWVALLQVAATGAICSFGLLLGLDRPIHLAWSPRLAFALTFTTLGATVAAFLLQAWGQKHVSATRAALLFATEPVFAALASTWLLGETWNPRRLTGAALILAAVAVAELRFPSTGRANGKLKPGPESEHISN
jgi:drug/metabolite transporter (DMT)-like permease